MKRYLRPEDSLRDPMEKLQISMSTVAKSVAMNIMKFPKTFLITNLKILYVGC
jgi:hypothetical protein